MFRNLIRSDRSLRTFFPFEGAENEKRKGGQECSCSFPSKESYARGHETLACRPLSSSARASAIGLGTIASLFGVAWP